LSAPNSLSFTASKNNLCLFLIWKLQKVYDENPDCGQCFLDLVKIKYQEARFSFQVERAFSLPILSINLCISKVFGVKNKKSAQAIHLNYSRCTP